MMEAGFSNIGCIILLVGASDPPEPRDVASAIEPARQFAAFLGDACDDAGVNLHLEDWDVPVGAVAKSASEMMSRVRGRFGQTLIQVRSRPDEVEAWSRRVATLTMECGEGEYLFNVTGGTAEMQFGALAGIDEAQRRLPGIRYSLVKFQVQPPRSITLYPRPSDVPLLIRHRDPSLGQMLTLSGLAEIDAPGRLLRQRRALARASFTHQLHEHFANGPTGRITGRQSELHRFLNPLTLNLDPDKVVDVPNGPKAVEEVLSLALDYAETSPSLLSIRYDGTGRVQCTVDDLRYLEAKWFEELAFLECHRRFGDAVHLNVRLRVRDGGPGDELGEVDVALLFGWQLHAIECKTKGFAGKRAVARGIDRDDVKSVGSLKRRLVGPVATAALLSFQEPTPDRKPYMATLAQEARGQGVEFWSGPRGLDSLRAWLSDVGRSMPPH
jgi:hypothetical protein